MHVTNETLLIRDGIVVTMDPAAGLLPSGTVVIRGNRLLEVTSDAAVVERYRGAAEIDASGCAVMPGLVNCHAHVRPMRALGEDMDVMTWHNQYVDGISARMTPDDAYFGAANAFLEMLKNGTTTVMAMSIIEPDDMRAAVDTGIRARIARHAERRPELEETIRLAEKQTATEEDRVRLWLGMELPAMFDDAELRMAGEAMEHLSLSLHTHFSEFRVDPLDPLERAGMLRPGLLLAHCVHVDEADSARMAAAGVAIAHNPKSNMKFGNGVAPLLRYLQQGFRVGFGTDGPLSTFSCDIFEEMRTATLLHRVVARNGSALPAQQALELATMGGARAFRLEHQIGSLTPGKRADLIVVDLSGPQFRPLFAAGPLPNVVSLLVFTATGRDVRDVVIDGRVVVRERRVLTVDEERIKAECQARAERLLGAIRS
jgi:5-methylthioadenosine/S-adenosylhomocysteine deaminase